MTQMPQTTRAEAATDDGAVRTVGSAVVRRITELERWPFAPAELFPGIRYEAIAEAAEAFPEAFDPATGELVLSIHSYLIELGGRTLLVDPGNGNRKQRPVLTAHAGFDTDLLERLAAASGGLDSIDLVLSTHLHPDHCGGGTTLDSGGDWVPAFPRAEYLFVPAELAALDGLRAAPASGTVFEDFARMFDDSIAPVLRTGRDRRVAAGEVLLEHEGTVVRLIAAPGHTAGHSAVQIEAPDGEGALIIGDAIHHPAQLAHPELSQAGDADPVLAAATRDQLLRHAAERGWAVLTAHFVTGSPEHVTITDDGRLAWGHPARDPA